MEYMEAELNFVYLLRCADDSLYCGWTTDLEARLRRHNAGEGAKYTRSRRPVTLAYVETYTDRHTALSREWYIKRMDRGEKLKLIQEHGGTDIMDERLEKQLAFALEIDKEKNVFRQTHLSGHGRNENDAEHSWHMAVMAYLLREYANEPVDIGKVMLMCLIHDIVEIDAGDTYAYDEAGKKTQKAREDAARERLFSLLPEDQKAELTALFDEFNARQTPEARFARAMDNLQPLILNHSNGGDDWKEHDVSAAAVYSRQSQTRLGSEKLFEVTDHILRENIEKGSLKP